MLHLVYNLFLNIYYNNVIQYLGVCKNENKIL